MQQKCSFNLLIRTINSFLHLYMKSLKEMTGKNKSIMCILKAIQALQFVNILIIKKYLIQIVINHKNS
jgi:hypothetical protein